MNLNAVYYESDLKDIKEVEFTIKEERESLEINCSFSEEAVVDIGLMFEDEVIGWSGGARKKIIISEYFSTPGYKRSKISGGKWKVLLGLYKFKEKVEVNVKVEVKPFIQRWMSGVTHLHTVHSDGRLTIPEVLAKAESEKFDYVFFTDHNTFSQNLALDSMNEKMLMIPGFEFSSYHGHAGIIGLNNPIKDFRWAVDDFNIKNLLEEAKNNGASIGINHPFCDNAGWKYPLENYDWIEIWNSIWSQKNQKALDWWTKQLREGKKIPVVGGSDFHKVKDDCDRFLCPVNKVLSKGYKKDYVIEAIKEGRSILLDRNFIEDLEFSSENGSLGVATNDKNLIVDLKGAPEVNEVILVTESGEEVLSKNKKKLNLLKEITFHKFGYILVKSGDKVIGITNPVYK